MEKGNTKGERGKGEEGNSKIFFGKASVQITATYRDQW